MNSFLLQPNIVHCYCATLSFIVPATSDRHCQVPESSKDEEEYEGYKIGLQGKGMDR